MNRACSQTITSRCTSRHEVFAAYRGTWFEPTSGRFVLVPAVGVGLVSFLATELMHYLLVPDLVRHHERLLADLSALVVTCLAGSAVLAKMEADQAGRSSPAVAGIGSQTPFLVRFFDSYLRNSERPEDVFEDLDA